MPIDITIIKSPENVNNSRTCHTFSESGGTIGRGPDNTWVLDDPEKYMSSVHTQVACENGQYILTDLSTNGTFVNGSGEPLGNGSKYTLKEGDRFAISDYEFVVNIRGTEQTGDALFNQPFDAGPFAEMPVAGENVGANFDAAPFPQNDPFSMPVNEHIPVSDAMMGLNNNETDPLAVLDKAGPIAQPASPFGNDPLSENSFGDNASSMNDQIDWPQANIESGVIPEDWDDDLSSAAKPDPIQQAPVPDFSAGDAVQDNSFANVEALSRLENEYLALENENKELMTEIARLKHYLNEKNSEKPSSARHNSRAFTPQDKTLIESMGLARWNLSKDKKTEISSTVGVLVRESIEGMMRVLSFRKKIKEEFRINVTTIQPVENNPLKFSANIDDAMENMFIKENNAYKEPIEAVREGFQGIADHQVAVLAGMQAAFRGMLERFDPETLEKRFEKYKKSGLIQFGQKGKNWESYKEFHRELINNMDNSFQHLFGYDFVQAYEDQMQRLVIARKANKNKKTNLG
ncbi:MAG: type VI secretion system-associated FHA domain protein TagH [Thioalkalispiraceae bacterium]|jgi:type VI secretion system FHA domain protein